MHMSQRLFNLTTVTTASDNRYTVMLFAANVEELELPLFHARNM
jgi:hypothetical protein